MVKYNLLNYLHQENHVKYFAAGTHQNHGCKRPMKGINGCLMNLDFLYILLSDRWVSPRPLCLQHVQP